MKILVTGASGMLGSEIVKQLKEKQKYKILATDSKDLNISDKKAVEDFIKKNSPEIIINCAAFTDVNKCESDFETCKLINATSVEYLAKAAKENQSLLIQVSSDYVFGENKEDGYEEDHFPLSPINKYGASKALGEEALVENTSNYYLIRTQWLYGDGAKNFIAKILELAEKLPELKVVTDEVGAPTYVKDLVERIIWMIENKKASGIYHITNEGKTTRYGFAKEIISLAGKDIKVIPTTHAEFGRGTKVPAVSILKNTKLPPMRSWKMALKEFINKT